MQDNFKSMQPCDWYEDKVKFPCILQPKIDGVASYNRYGALLGRSLKKHENRFATAFFSQQEYHGFGGEMTSGDKPTGDDLCRITSGDLRRRDTVHDFYWWLFDYVPDDSYLNISYFDRYHALTNAIKELPDHLKTQLKIIPSHIVTNMQELLDLEEMYLNMGYEGVILRDPKAGYKYGRCGKTFMGAWRIKRFIDAEFLITEILEGNENLNEAKINELGRTERSTHQENMKPNGLVGTIRGTLLADVVDPQSKKILLEKGLTIDVSPGNMLHSQRKHFFENPEELLQKIGKFKLFPKGIKDKPRFPQFMSIRNENDL
jgi:DNA ligase-1